MNSIIEWHLFETEKPKLKKNELYPSKLCLITIPQGKKLETICARWKRTTVRDKVVERWEWNGKICPWTPVHWAEMPEPPTENA